MDKKYEFTGETMEFEGRTLRRIRYLRSLGIFVQKGSLGGWIESEHNLSHEGQCCVLHEAKVLDYARVEEDGRVTDTSIFKDNAVLRGRSSIFGGSIVGADTIIEGTVWIREKCRVFFYENSLNNSESQSAHILGDCDIYGETEIEATGTIINCEIRNQSLSGHLKLSEQSLS